MAQRQSRGRQRIPIQKIENQDSRYATFSKRRVGLYKKASELCTLCGVDIGIITFSPTGTPPYSFFSPTMESVIDRYENPNMQPDDGAVTTDSQTKGRIAELNHRLDESRAKKEAQLERAEILEENDRTRQKEWWEEIPVEQMNQEQVKELKTWFEYFLSNSSIRMDQLRNGASASSTFQP
ncbi:hypothetical protein ACJIZ3_002651 [Penstemon smallii]|uniref:MADS-box domain-containing protein n=1 Tax=Penstemon smallii TaxID=265156 RepID=A0ABD3U9T8_9LAMI